MDKKVKKGRFVRAAAFFGMAVLLITGIAAGSAEAQATGGKKKYVITGGTVGAPIYAVGGLLATLIDEKMPGVSASVTTGQGFTALEQVHKGDAQIGMAPGFVIASAIAGKDPFKEPRKDIRILGRMAGLYYQFLILENKNVSSLAEIKEKKLPIKLTTSPKGSLSEFSARKVLGAYAITFEDIAKWGGKVSHVSWADSANLMRDGHADAVSLFGVAPIPVFSELDISRPIRLLVPDDDVARKLLAGLSGWNIVNVAPGTYKTITKPVPTLGTYQTMVVRADMPEEDAYHITKLAFDTENLKKFKGLIRDYADAFAAGKGAEDLPAPLHPGAEKYYRERGWIK